MKKIVINVISILCLFLICGCNNGEEKDPIENNVNGDVEELTVKMVNGDIVEGKGLIHDFYLRTRNGEKLKIVINKTYTETESNYINYIIYDGEYYITNDKVYENSPNESKYKYFNYSKTDGNGRHIIGTEAYCLSNKENITYEDIMNSWLSSILDRHITDAIPIYCECHYIDLCFYQTQVSSIIYNLRRYQVNNFNCIAAQEMVDCLSWKKGPLEGYGKNNFSLTIDMTRKILNDANGILLGKKDGVIFVTYKFDFEKKIAIMSYPYFSSIHGQLYAEITDESIEKLERLFSIYQGSGETNWGEYYSDNLMFILNEDKTGYIKVLDTSYEEEITNITTFGDGKLYINTTKGRYTFEFGEKSGYAYVRSESEPSSALTMYLENEMIFEWKGYPLK